MCVNVCVCMCANHGTDSVALLWRLLHLQLLQPQRLHFLFYFLAMQLNPVRMSLSAAPMQLKHAYHHLRRHHHRHHQHLPHLHLRHLQSEQLTVFGSRRAAVLIATRSSGPPNFPPPRPTIPEEGHTYPCKIPTEDYAAVGFPYKEKLVICELIQQQLKTKSSTFPLLVHNLAKSSTTTARIQAPLLTKETPHRCARLKNIPQNTLVKII